MDAQIVIRSCGERSLPLCLQAIEQQQGNPIVIKEAPFIQAITKTFEIGKDSLADWLIAVDADIILNPNALSTMIEGASEMLKKAPNLFLLKFPLIDKFRGTCLGCHVYNNKYSKQVYEFFKDIPYDPLDSRPEKTNTLKFAEKLQLLNTSYHEAVGLHDYEQYYNHIYVKYYRQAVRQPAFIPEIIERILQRRMEYVEDLDFVVALFGLYSGEGKTETYTDSRLYPKIEEVMGVQEKAPISLV